MVVLLLIWAGWGCGCGAGYKAGGCPGFGCDLLCLQIMIKIKILNSIKTEVQAGKTGEKRSCGSKGSEVILKCPDWTKVHIK